ncbi:hypothetical protein [Candidatus Poriferisodalis sp.]|uniref:hypothetical protein n=1 Tax=Candidatus Poriferisodalis sp. TaxID=3101277 RepID=UPI003B014743
MTAAPCLAYISSGPQASVVLLATLVSALALAAVIWRWLRRRMRRERWIRPNYRDHRVVAVSGLIVIAASAVVVVIAAIVSATLPEGERQWAVHPPQQEMLLARSPDAATIAGCIAALVLLVGFGWLGYRDDQRGSQADQRVSSGFIGHLRLSWRQRALTTGLQKAVGGAVVALIGAQVALWGDPGEARRIAGANSADWLDPVLHALGLRTGPEAMWSLMALVRGALIVALGANLLNLLDRVPGRATKTALAWWLVGLAPAAIVASSSPGRFGLGADTAESVIWAAAAVGAAVGLLRSEMAEQHMQGDVGVNPLGALLGMATVAAYPATVEWAVLAALAALNLASERWSFSRVIDAVPPLRWLDRLGSPCRHC